MRAAAQLQSCGSCGTSQIAEDQRMSDIASAISSGWGIVVVTETLLQAAKRFFHDASATAFASGKQRHQKAYCSPKLKVASGDALVSMSSPSPTSKRQPPAVR